MSDIGVRMSDIISDVRTLDVRYDIVAPVSFCRKGRPIFQISRSGATYSVKPDHRKMKPSKNIIL